MLNLLFRQKLKLMPRRLLSTLKHLRKSLFEYRKSDQTSISVGIPVRSLVWMIEPAILGLDVAR